MIDHILLETVSLGKIRIQKIFLSKENILAFEVYTHNYKQLYIIFDVNHETKSFHISFKKPQVSNISNRLLLLLKKHLIAKVVQFNIIESDMPRIKIDINNYTLLFYLENNYAVALFNNKILDAFMGHRINWDYDDNIRRVTLLSGLEHNWAQALKYESLQQNIFLLKRQKNINEMIAKKQKLIKNVESDLYKCQINQQMLADAELLKANLHKIKKGDQEISLIDYAINPPLKRTLILNPSLSPSEILTKMFQSIKKAKRGIDIIENRLVLLRRELNDLYQYKDYPSENDIDHILPKIEKKPSKRLGYFTYISSDNITILVGRSAKDADELISSYRHGNHWWFHVNDAKGAHVVVKSNDLPKQTILEAALLAKHFSKLKNDTRALVDYTRIKYVKKPKKAAPGLVLITQEKKVEIKDDQDMLSSLLQRKC